jgi:predicted ABC-type ATPase
VSAPRAWILAGPNGAGKTTFAREFLMAEAHCPTFINADLIAAGLAPFMPATVSGRAMRLLLEELDRCVTQRRDFAIESTLAGRSYLKHIQSWKALGYRVKIAFLRLPVADLAVHRVRQRVAQGGHDIPEGIIRRRFQRGLENFHKLYRPLADSWQLYDASEWPPVLVAEGGKP